LQRFVVGILKEQFAVQGSTERERERERDELAILEGS
jgi:hypothetical protein